jgi:hypothetical protein
MDVISVRSIIDLPDCGPPTIAPWPAAPEKSAHSRSRRCSNGLSTTPSGTWSLPLEKNPGEVSPRSSVACNGGSRVSSDGGSFSGGSHTSCAGGPWPTSRSTMTSSSLGSLLSFSFFSCLTGSTGLTGSLGISM